MRKSSILSLLIVTLSTPALAADADIKQQVEQIGSAYAESFNKQDAAGIASYEGFWVTRRDQAAWFTGASRTSMPSLNLTPATIFGK
jgi:hypothetical protein